MASHICPWRRTPTETPPRADSTPTDSPANSDLYVIPLQGEGETKTKSNFKTGQILVDAGATLSTLYLTQSQQMGSWEKLAKAG